MGLFANIKLGGILAGVALLVIIALLATLVGLTISRERREWLYFTSQHDSVNGAA